MNSKGFLGAITFLIILALAFSFSAQVNAVTWSVNTVRFTTYEYYDGYPTMTQTQDMGIWLLWSKEIMGNSTLYYKVSSNLGKTWSNEKNLTQETGLGTGRHQDPAIMQAENGTIWVTWSAYVSLPPPIYPEFNLTAAPQELSIPQGTSGESNLTVTSINGFSEAVKFTVIDLPGGVTTSFNPPQVTPPPNEQVNSTLAVSVSSTATPGNYTFSVLGKSATVGHAIDINLEITSSSGGLSAVARLDHAATKTVEDSSSMTNYEIYYKTSHDNGATWSGNIRFTNNNANDRHPAILQLQNGTIVIIWQSSTSGNDDLWYRTTTDGISWSASTQLTVDMASDTAPSMIQTRNGQVWVAWSSNRLGNYTIYYKTYDGTSWSSDTLLPSTVSLSTNVQPAIVQAVDGSILIFYASDILGTFDIYYTASADSGSNWSAKVSFVASQYTDASPSVMRAQDTKIWATWASDEADQPDGNWDVYYKTSLAGDVNEDSVVDVVDLNFVSFYFGFTKDDPIYDITADINRDGIVDMRDMRVVAFYIDER